MKSKDTKPQEKRWITVLYTTQSTANTTKSITFNDKHTFVVAVVVVIGVVGCGGGGGVCVCVSRIFTTRD